MLGSPQAITQPALCAACLAPSWWLPCHANAWAVGGQHAPALFLTSAVALVCERVAAGAGGASVWRVPFFCWLLGLWGPLQPRNSPNSACSHRRWLAFRRAGAARIPLHLQVSCS